MKLKDKRLFLLDMDGTLYIDNNIFDGTKEFLNYINSIGGKYVFLSNNSSRGIDSYIEKMKKMGITCTPNDFMTSTDVCIKELKKNYENEVVYVCGTKSFKKQLEDSNIKIREELSDDITMLLLGYDTELTYKKLEDCCILLNRNVKYMATHPDMVCPTSYGYAPDCGSLIEMLYTATEKRPIVVGKPKKEIALYAMEKFGFTKDETCLIGDRIYTDILCGVNAGIDTVFVLSGEGVKEDIKKYNIYPTYIKENVKSILESIKKGE